MPSKYKPQVVIDAVSPIVSNGQFPARIVVNEDFVISADIFSDGNDVLDASLFIRRQKDRGWKEFPLTKKENDKWEVSIRSENPGIIQYRILPSLELPLVVQTRIA